MTENQTCWNPNAVNSGELCQGPSQSRHLEQQKGHPKRGRNVVGNVGETSSSLEYLVGWCGFGIFVGARA